MNSLVRNPNGQHREGASSGCSLPAEVRREACIQDRKQDSQDHAGNTRQHEIVLWMCIALLALLSAGAFYVLWGKANGTMSSVECSPKAFCPVIVGFLVSGIN